MVGLGLLTAIASLIAMISWNGAGAIAFVLMMVGLLLLLIGRVLYFVSLVEGHINHVEARLTEGTKCANGSSG